MMNDFFVKNPNGLKKEDFIEADKDIDLSCLPSDFQINSVSDLQNAKEGDLSFFIVSLVSGEKYKSILETTKASYIILKKQYQKNVKEGIKAIISSEPYITFVRLCKKLLVEKQAEGSNEIDATAKIAENSQIGKSGVKIGKNVIIEAFVNISDGVEIGDNTIIKSGAKIGNNCKIGKNCIVRENCVIQFSKIGDNCCFHANSSIGQDGFGYSFDSRTGKNEKIDHFGIVSIGNNVEIGTNSCIDRSVFGETIIEDNVKIDNLVQIAHNAKIGCGTMMAGQSAVAGSATVGKYCVLGGKSGVVGHITIGDKCVVYGDAKVTKNFPNNSKIIGTPGEFYHIWIRNYAFLQSIMSKKMNHLKSKRFKKNNSNIIDKIASFFKSN